MLNIFHERNRILKDSVVDTLENVADSYATLVKHSTVSVVDVAAAVRLGTQKFAINLKLARDSTHIML
jgi:hypothetical protein